MKGVGSYNDWTYYAQPPSYNNWAYSTEVPADSTYASVPPIHYGYGYGFYSNPVGEFDSSTQVLDSSRAQFPHSEDAFSYDQFSNGAKSSLAEAPPYYPSYVSSAIHDPISHWSSSSGFPSVGDYAENKSPELGFSGHSAALWNQFEEFNRGNGKQEGVASSFSSMQANVSVAEESMNQGFQDVKDSEVSNAINLDKYNVPMIEDQLDDKSCWWRTIKPLHSSPMPLDKHNKAFLKSVSDSGNHHLSGTSVMQSSPMSLEKDFFLSGTSVAQSSPMSLEKDFFLSGTSVKQSPPISPEDHHKDHYKAALKLFSDSGNRHSSGTSVKQSPPISPEDHHKEHIKAALKLLDSGNHHSSGTSVKQSSKMSLEDCHKAALKLFPSSSNYHLSHAGSYDQHLRQHDKPSRIDEPSSSNNGMIAEKNVIRGVVDYIFKAGLGFQNPHASGDNLSLRVGANEDLNSVEKSFDGGDRCNPAVDSPCWKGAPAAHFSQHASPEPLLPEYVHKNEVCIGSIIQEPQNLLDTENNMKKSCEDSKSYQVHIEIAPQKTNSAGSSSKFLVTKSVSEECKLDGAVNAGPFQSKPSFDNKLQFFYDSTEMKENCVPPTKPIDCMSSHTEHQVTGENKLTSQKQNTSSISSADAGSNVNKCLDISHTTPEKSAKKVSAQKLNVQTLVDTMQHLSELLLYHSLNNACELEERDCNVLKSVISNLNTCVSKNEQTSAAQECLSPRPESFSCAGDLCHLQQNASSKRPQLTKIGPESSMVDLENSLVQEENLHIMSGKPHSKIPDSVCPSGDTEMTKADNMTKALKEILSENFHDNEGADGQTVLYKNLWLEAEAALCSVNYKARYNQMKIEMERHSHKQRAVDMEEQSKSEAVRTLSKSQSPAAKAPNHPKFGVWIPNLNSPEQDLPVMSATNINELSDLKFSTDMNKPNALTPEEKSNEDLDSFIQNYYTVSGINKEAGNDEASVMARYCVLKARLDENVEAPSDITEKLAPGGRDDQNQVSFSQDSPIPEKNKAGYDASIVARFHILKSRIEDSSYISSEGNLLDGVESDGPKNASEGESLDLLVNPAGMNLTSSYTAINKPIPKELNLDIEDDQEVHPLESQLRTCSSDGLASDWEHVE